MATPFSYTVPNWKEGSPYAAETAIDTGIAQQDPGAALPLLGILRAQRESNQLDYMNELQGQHAFAAQQAAIHTRTQDQENLMKLLERGEKNAGTLGVANNSPLLSPLLAGTDLDMLQQHAALTKQQTDAEAYEKAGKGYRDFRYAGGYTAPGVVSNMLAPAGVQISDVEPIDITASRERGLASGIGTASGAPDTARGGGSSTMKIVKMRKPDGTIETPEEARDRTLREVDPRSPTSRGLITPQRSPVSGVLPPSPSPQQSPMPAPDAAQPRQQVGAPPVPPPGQTQAPIAPVPGPGARMEVAPSGTPGKPEAQAAGRAALVKLAAVNQPKYLNIVSRMTEEGGDVPVALIPGTGWVLVGKDGVMSEIPGFTRAIKTDRSGNVIQR